MLLRLIPLFCVVSVCVFFVNGAKLPKFFHKCFKDDPALETCVAKSGNEAMKHLADGNNQIHFPSLRPLKVPFMQVDVGQGLKLNLTNSEISGIENLHIDSVKIDLVTRKYDFKISTARFEHLGQYDISGRILILPIYGHGPINTTFINSKIDFSFDYDIKEVKGKGYLVPKNPKHVTKVERAYFKLDNLFDGNKELSEEMSIFLDENWREVHEELGPRLDDVIGELLNEIIKGFTSRVPFDDMFAKPINNSTLK